MAKPELSEYEEQRKANIAERDALLRKLALNAADAGLAPRPVKSSTKAHNPPRKKAPTKKVKEEIVPRRTSSRLAGLEADSDKAKRKAEDEYNVAQEAARVKRQRVSGDLDLRDIVVAGQEWSMSAGSFELIVERGSRPYERTFGAREVKETSDKELRRLREKLSGLELYSGFEPNSLPPPDTGHKQYMLIIGRDQDHARENLLPRLSSRTWQAFGLRGRQAW